MKFGDFVLNRFVSPADPRRTSYVVDHQGSRVECTDGEGKFWWTPVEALEVIGSLDLKNIKFGEAVEHSVEPTLPDRKGSAREHIRDVVESAREK